MARDPVPLPLEMSDSGAAAIAARHHDGLYRFALGLSRRDRQEALGIVQQTYLEVLEGRADLAGARNPRAYLFGVARRVAASRRRRRSIWGRILGYEQIPEPSRPELEDPEDAAAGGERTARLKAALGELPARQLEVISAVFGGGMTVEEAAEAMGVSVGSARTHYHRAKRRLKKLMTEGTDAT
jgi:RNA polymerase sigma-70 factor (ECF subfamily)